MGDARGAAAGQLRSVSKVEKRVAAAVNLGFTRVVAPHGTRAAVSPALRGHVVDCRDVGELVQLVRGKAMRRARGKAAKAESVELADVDYTVLQVAQLLVLSTWSQRYLVSWRYVHKPHMTCQATSSAHETHT